MKKVVKMEKKPQWICVRGSLTRGIEVYGPFDDEAMADDFDAFFCAVDCETTEVIRLRDPYQAKTMPGETKIKWAEIVEQTPQRRELERRDRIKAERNRAK